MLVRSECGAVFGAFLSDAWRRPDECSKFYGNGTKRTKQRRCCVNYRFGKNANFFFFFFFRNDVSVFSASKVCSLSIIKSKIRYCYLFIFRSLTHTLLVVEWLFYAYWFGSNWRRLWFELWSVRIGDRLRDADQWLNWRLQYVQQLLATRWLYEKVNRFQCSQFRTLWCRLARY